MQSEKRNEFATYKRLGLSREHKSKANRRKAEVSKQFRYIGGDAPERPFLKVLRREYLQLWDDVNARLAQTGDCENPNAPDLRRRKVEQLVYEEIARRQELLLRLEEQFQKQNGRKMTPHERERYSALLHDSPATPDARAQAGSRRRALFTSLLNQVERSQRHQPGRLRDAWAQVVGAEAAQETVLEKVDTVNGIAVCRCLSSTMAHQIRRKKDLAKRLSKELGLSIQRVVFR